MEKEFKQLKKEMWQIHLSGTEKDVMRKRLADFMRKNPAQPIMSPIRKSPIHISFAYAVRRFGVVALILTLIFGTTTALASERALPGDALYPVKLGIESVQDILIQDEERGTAFAMERAERRLAEAEQLAAEGIIDASTHQQITLLFQKHIDIFTELSPSSKTASEARADFEVSLAVHEQVLTALKEDGKAPLDPLIRTVRIQRLAFSSGNTSPLRATAPKSAPSDDGIEAATMHDDTATMQVRSLNTSTLEESAARKLEGEVANRDMNTGVSAETKTSGPTREIVSELRDRALVTLERAEKALAEKNAPSASESIFIRAQETFSEGEALFEERSLEEASETFKSAEYHARKAIAVIKAEKRVQFIISPDILIDSVEMRRTEDNTDPATDNTDPATPSVENLEPSPALNEEHSLEYKESSGTIEIEL